MRTIAMVLLILGSSGCASWRWSPKPPRDEAAAARVLRSPSGDQLHPAPAADAWDLAEISLSTSPRAPAGPAEELPETPPERLREAVYYSDLGPDRLELADYPLQQRANYRTYAQACARCHTLARSINAPYADRRWWAFYVTSMRVRARMRGRPFTKEELTAVLDFLEYDGKVRKLGRRAEFDAQTRELRRRFDALVDERMRRLQEQGRP